MKHEMIPLSGTLTFELPVSKPTQTFQLYAVGEEYSYIKVEFSSNHGNREYTCIYRIRVHGAPDPSFDFSH